MKLLDKPPVAVMIIDPPSTITRAELKRKNRAAIAALVVAIGVPVLLIGLFGPNWLTISISIGVAWVCFALIIPDNATGVFRRPKIVCEDAVASVQAANEKNGLTRR
jgi:hypothetical protein